MSARRASWRRCRRVRRTSGSRCAAASRSGSPTSWPIPERDAFYPAAGLGDASLDLLRAGPSTLDRLTGLCGRRWMEKHARRLVALDLAGLEEA